MIHDEGCTEAQGFLFSKPAPATEVLEILAKQRRKTSTAA